MDVEIGPKAGEVKEVKVAVAERRRQARDRHVPQQGVMCKTQPVTAPIQPCNDPFCCASAG